MEEKIQMLLDWVTREEDRYYDLAIKEMDKGNMFGNQMMTAQATVFQRVRYSIQDMMEID